MTHWVSGHSTWFGLIALASLLTTSTGCTRMLATAAYMWKGNVVDPDYTGLTKKKVAVVCRPVVQLSTTQTNGSKVEADIARALGIKLQTNIRGIRIIDAQKIEEWTDVHEWNDYKEIGAGLGADMVVAVDLQDFQLMPGQTLYQGKAKATVKVYDMKDGGRIVYQKHLPQTIYPPNAVRTATEVQPDQFRREFIDVFSEEMGRIFYPYETKLNFARDTAVLDR